MDPSGGPLAIHLELKTMHSSQVICKTHIHFTSLKYHNLGEKGLCDMDIDPSEGPNAIHTEGGVDAPQTGVFRTPIQSLH